METLLNVNSQGFAPGAFDGILGMDWLSKNQAEIQCHKETLSFVDLHQTKVQVDGNNGIPSL